MAWLRRFLELEDPDLRLICFPHAGGGAHSYHGWADEEAPLKNIELVCVDPPGRGQRHSEQPVTGMKMYVEAVVSAMDLFFDRPFAFFGHSLGALVAYEVTLELRRRSLPVPIYLVVSANIAPQLHFPGDIPSLSEDSKKRSEFVEKVGREWGFITQEALENSDLLSVMLPPLHADLQIWARYRAESTTSMDKLRIPVLVLAGTDDKTLDDAGLNGWRDTSEVPIIRKQFRGGHFYLEEARNDVLTLVNSECHRALSTMPLAVMLGEQCKRTEFEHCVHELFEKQVLRIPDQEALVGLERSYSYKELDTAATILARRLQQLGVARAAPVGVYLAHSEQYVIANVAIFKAGGSMFLMETSYTSQLIADFLHDSNTEVVLTFASMRENLPTTSAGGRPLKIVEMDGDHWLRALEADASLPPLAPHGLTPEDPAYYTMTSGSTGKPKAVENSHFGSVLCFMGRNVLYPYLPGEREGLNMFFAWECLRAVIFGSAAVVIPDSLIFDPPKLVRYIREHKITRLMTTPSLLTTILTTPGIDFPRYLSHTKYWWLEGEVVPLRLVDKFVKAVPECSLVNLYSSWEALDTAHGHLTDPHFMTTNRQSLVAPVGAVMPEYQAYVCDDQMRLKRVDQPGDLYVGTPAMFLGCCSMIAYRRRTIVEIDLLTPPDRYLNDPVKTASKLVKNPWADSQCNLDLGSPDYVHSPSLYQTGDRARVRSDGQLEIMGRADSTVKIRAFKVGLNMVENSISELEGVGSAAVTPVLNSATKQPEDLVAYVIGVNGQLSTTELQNLRANLAKKLPDYAVPVYWVPMTQFPQKKGESRKLDRAALPPPGPEHNLSKEFRSLSHYDSSIVAPLGQATDENSDVMVVEMLRIFKEVLGVDDMSPLDNFFEMGGHSLMAATLVGRLNELGITVSITDLYQHPSVEGLSIRVLGATSAVSQKTLRSTKKLHRGGPIAVIGISGEFPGALTIHTLWENLRNGVDAVRKIHPEEYAARGFPKHLWQSDEWTPAAYAVANADKFDSSFFGIGTREAVIMDPQHRRFMQCAWESLETAGYAPKSGTPSRTAVFAAAGIDGYMHHHLDGVPLKDFGNPGQVFLGEVGSEKDYIATRVSYAIDGGGPSLNVNSACSSGLVAVAQAVRALQSGDCDMAVAGAASLSFPNLGYMYGEGLVGSRDGKVKPFDAHASGTVFGDSVAAVVLKRLDEAEADGDFVWGVVSGAAVTNDGRQKAAYTAPSAQAQAAAMVDALAEAQRSPRDVSYVECHATATLLGDGIELSGLAEVFSTDSGDNNAWCALGSIKGNIGHANCAAGMTGFIKTLLCLHHKELVPTMHYETPNPKLSLDHPTRKPFYIPEKRMDWVPSDSAPHRIAGVSSFGIGGTNCHLIVEEYPTATLQSPKSPQCIGNNQSQLLTFSAKSVVALQNTMMKTAEYLSQTKGTQDLATIAETLHRGREEFTFRTFVVANTTEDAVKKIRAAATEVSIDSVAKKNARVVFMFPGQGSHYLNMARDLYSADCVFRKNFEACAEEAQSLLKSLDIRQLLLSDDAKLLEDPCAVQLAIFGTEYSMAQLLMNLGIRPTALAGHSIGEYAAAVVGGILKLSVAVRLIFTRASTVRDDCPPGGMLSVPISPEDADNFAADFNDRNSIKLSSTLSVAAYNDPNHVALSGSTNACQQAEAELRERGLRVRPLRVTHAFHSPLLQPAADAVLAVVNSLKGDQIPTLGDIPVTSNVTGEWMTEEVTTGEYWSEQIVGPVRWTQNVAALVRWHPECFVEVGPGTTLGYFVNSTLQSSKTDGQVYSTMRHAKDNETDDVCAILSAVGNLWSRGVKIDWSAFHGRERRLHDPCLPTYGWDEQSYWTAPEKSIYVDPSKRSGQSSGGSVSQQYVDWLVRYSPTQAVSTDPRDAPILLFCFPYAGGSSRVFEKWANKRSNPPWLDIIAVEPPQRGVRADEDVRNSGEEDVEIVVQLIRAELEANPRAKWALCGFSRGCLVAVEVAIKLISAGYGHRLITLAVAGRSLPVNLVGDDIAYDLETLNLAPPSVRASNAWESRFKPMLLSDLSDDSHAARRIASLHQSNQLAGLVGCDLLVFYGESDASFTRGQADDWRILQKPCTSSEPSIFRVSGYPDGHSFLDSHSDEMCNTVIAVLGRHQPPSAEVLHSVRWIPCSLSMSQRDFQDVGELPKIHTFSDTSIAGVTRFQLSNSVSSDIAVELETQWGLVLLVDSEEIEAATAECWQFVQLLQAISFAELSGRILLLCSTAATAGLIPGLSKAAALEIPDVQIQRVYVQGKSSIEELRRAVALSQVYTREHDLWIKWTGPPSRKKCTVLTQRLQVEPSLDGPCASRSMSLSGTYIVTGGTGGVGAAIIEWLAEACSVPRAQIVVLCRNPASPGAQRLSGKGVSVVGLDCSDPKAIADSRELGDLTNVAGVFHLAGVLEDSLVANLTHEALARVVHPKATGALALLARVETLGWELDFWVNFSSSSSLLGYAGQGNYCAANSVLDQLAAFTTNIHRGPPMVTINWGPWLEAGMAAPGTKAYAQALKDGDRPLSNATALAHLGQVISNFEASGDHRQQYLITDVDWCRSPWEKSRLVLQCQSGRLIKESLAPINDNTSSTSTGAISRIELPDGDSENSKRARIEGLMKEMVPTWNPEATLPDAGLDSLDVVQLRNAIAKDLQIKVPLSAFNKPNQTLGGLVGVVVSEATS